MTDHERLDILKKAKDSGMKGCQLNWISDFQGLG